jgi:T-complex protein 1 subunit alpha
MIPINPGSIKMSGERQTGGNVRVQNGRAAESLAQIVASPLGPMGLDKTLVDDVGEVTLTNDGPTILRNLDVQHPAAKVLIRLSELQDREVGDGTTTVVLLAAELIRLGQTLIDLNVIVVENRANLLYSSYL